MFINVAVKESVLLLPTLDGAWSGECGPPRTTVEGSSSPECEGTPRPWPLGHSASSGLSAHSSARYTQWGSESLQTSYLLTSPHSQVLVTLVSVVLWEKRPIELFSLLAESVRKRNSLEDLKAGGCLVFIKQRRLKSRQSLYSNQTQGSCCMICIICIT